MWSFYLESLTFLVGLSPLPASPYPTPLGQERFCFLNELNYSGFCMNCTQQFLSETFSVPTVNPFIPGPLFTLL